MKVTRRVYKKLSGTKMFRHLAKFYGIYLFISYTTVNAYFLLFSPSYFFPTLIPFILFVLLVSLARQCNRSVLGKYTLAAMSFIVFFTVIQFRPVEFNQFTRFVFGVPLIYAYLLPDIVAPNIVGSIIAYIFSTYASTSSIPQSAINSCIFNIIVTSIGYTILFYLGRRLAKSEQSYKSLFENNTDGVFATDLDGKIFSINPAAQKITGYESGALLHRSFASLVVPEDFDKVVQYFQKAAHKPQHFQTAIIGRDGQRRELAVTAIPIIVQDKTTGIYSMTKDITKQIQLEERLKYLSFHDFLTGFYNRYYFEQEMDRFEDASCAPLCVIVCDIDGLKFVNDTLGHSKGDTLILAAANAIQKALCKQDFVARIGGDEFAILLPSSDEKHAEMICRNILEGVEEFNQTGPEIHLSMSIGYAVSGQGPVNMNELFKKADNNMYKQKLLRKNSTRSTAIKTLMKALEARDFITEGHATRLEELLATMGQEIGLPEQRIADLLLLARFHDIGKAGVPERILFKPGPLTSEEFVEIQRHCEIGNHIASFSPDIEPIADYILKHHEWWNGKGYPLGLQGEEIPLECRILAIADAYDAMTNDRPYRKAMSHREAIAELQRCAGTQFDPSLVAKFIEVLEQKMYNLTLSAT